jgi:hypothetical protein
MGRISSIGNPETLSKPDLLKCITSLRIWLGKGRFDAHVWVILLLDVIDIVMILVTYEPMGGIIFATTGPSPVDMYIWVYD